MRESERDVSFLKCKKTYNELLITPPDPQASMLLKLDSLNGEIIVLFPPTELITVCLTL